MASVSSLGEAALLVHVRRERLAAKKLHDEDERVGRRLRPPAARRPRCGRRSDASSSRGKLSSTRSKIRTMPR